MVSSVPEQTENSPLGKGWTISSIPVLEGNDVNITIRFGGQLHHFGADGQGGYRPRILNQSRLLHDPATHQFIYANETGELYEFNDLSAYWPEAKRGRFNKLVDTAGSVTEVVAEDADGRILDIQRSVSMGGMTGYESFLYGWAADGTRLENMTLRRRMDTQPWETIERIDYANYPVTNSYGQAGDLMQVSRSNGANQVLDRKHYRYTHNQTNELFDGRIRTIVDGRGFDRLAALLGSTDPSSWNDAAVSQYATDVLTYDDDGRVVSWYHAGYGVTNYAYELSNHSSQINHWRFKQVATLPNGSKSTIHANARGQVILSEVDPTDSTEIWLSHNRFDGYGNLVQSASAAAVSGYNPLLPDLVGYSSGNAVYLYDNKDFVTHYDYYTDTTATQSVAGGVATWIEQIGISQGETGLLIPQAGVNYFARGDAQDMARVHPIANTISYPEGYGVATQYAYTWHPDTVRAPNRDDDPAERGPVSKWQWSRCAIGRRI